MSRKKIAFAGPWITQKEKDYALDAVENGWYETYDKHVKLLEAEIRRYLDKKFALATHCCTLALHLSCAALGLERGDEVICTDFSWVATAYAITYTGATPVFVDIDPDSWCISPEAVRRAITQKTKAIMLVHCFGHPCDMDPIMEIARENGLAVIEDAAPSMGARYKGKKTGTFGDFGCFSFHGAKITVSGEGGILVTDDAKLFERVQLLASMGRTDSRAVFWSDMEGYQYTMGNIAASLALAQMERVDELVAKKREIFHWYKQRLENTPGVKLITEKEHCFSNYCYPSLLLTNSTRAKRDAILLGLKELNVHCRPAFPRMSRFPSLPMRYENPVAKQVEERGISLASAANITEEDVEFVCRAFTDLLGV